MAGEQTGEAVARLLDDPDHLDKFRLIYEDMSRTHHQLAHDLTAVVACLERLAAGHSYVARLAEAAAADARGDPVPASPPWPDDSVSPFRHRSGTPGRRDG